MHCGAADVCLVDGLLCHRRMYVTTGDEGSSRAFGSVVHKHGTMCRTVPYDLCCALTRPCTRLRIIEVGCEGEGGAGVSERRDIYILTF